jgi:uncharacterized repeat protein (TIGR03803 family)
MKLNAFTSLGLMLFLLSIVFPVSANAQTFSVLYNFAGGADGYNPIGGLIVDHRGNLYGTTLYGGNFGVGTAFRVDASGGEQVLHSFGGTGDGYNPVTELLSDGEGNLFGTTLQGGPAGKGVVFKLDENGFETILHSFFGTDGAHPYGALAFDSSGSLNRHYPRW